MMNEHYLKSFGCSLRLHKNQGKTSCGNSAVYICKLPIYGGNTCRRRDGWTWPHLLICQSVRVLCACWIYMCMYVYVLRANWIVNSNLQSYFDRNIFIPIHKIYTSSSKVLMQLNCTVYRTFTTLYLALFRSISVWVSSRAFVSERARERSTKR